MPWITYIESNGVSHLIQVPAGISIMQGAVDAGVPGIAAECGGECACATCHVYIDAAWLKRIGLPREGSEEAGMLSFATDVSANSRLACQIAVTDALDGLTVRIPERQR